MAAGQISKKLRAMQIILQLPKAAVYMAAGQIYTKKIQDKFFLLILPAEYINN